MIRHTLSSHASFRRPSRASFELRRRQTAPPLSPTEDATAIQVEPLQDDENKNRISTEPLKTIILNGHEELQELEEEEEEFEAPNIEVTINFELYFKWLEIIMWITMLAGIIWSLVRDFQRATREECNLKDPNNQDDYLYPFNILPSLSRSMSSFRTGLAIWTIAMAFVFVARLLSTHSLHRMYKVWYEESTLNYILLKFTYVIDVLEITVLLMIPAFSLDCDPTFHTLFFIIFICLTFTAELLQYCTKFLKRAKGVILDEAVQGYYTHILLLLLLQALFIVLMLAGNLIHKYTCTDYLYSVFAICEYITVIINVRFKRDTIRFVR